MKESDINLDEDPEALTGLKPCGFSKETMIGLEKLAEHQINNLILREA